MNCNVCINVFIYQINFLVCLSCCHVSFLSMSVFPPPPGSGLLSPSLSLWPGPAQTYHAAHCGLGRPAEEWRGDHFLSDSARPVFRDWRDATHSQRDCSKLSGTGQISTWIPWNEENLTKLLFEDKRDLLTFFQNILFIHLFLGVETIRWFSPLAHNGGDTSPRHETVAS